MVVDYADAYAAAYVVAYEAAYEVAYDNAFAVAYELVYLCGCFTTYLKGVAYGYTSAFFPQNTIKIQTFLIRHYTRNLKQIKYFGDKRPQWARNGFEFFEE